MSESVVSNVKKPLYEFNNLKHQNWLQKRRLRLEQVRRQSNELAKTLRQKILSEHQCNLNVNERLSNVESTYLKALELKKLENELADAAEDFGIGHLTAEEESALVEVINTRKKANLMKAMERGEVAMIKEKKQKKLENEKFKSPIQRKKMCRKIENLRSALVSSLPMKKKSMDLNFINVQEDICPLKNLYSEGKKKEENILTKFKDKKIEKGARNNYCFEKVKNKEIKKISAESNSASTIYNKKDFNELHTVSQDDDTVWINLNEIKLSNIDTSQKSEGCKMLEIKTNQSVIFYDYASRSCRKSGKEYPYSIEKIDEEIEQDSSQLDEDEAKKESKELTKKKADLLRYERGVEALRKEKIKQNYDSLLKNLEKLSKKEKILKTEQKVPYVCIHMNDDRLSEKAKMKQKIMNSKFESIIYDIPIGFPHSNHKNQSQVFVCKYAGGDAEDFFERFSTKLSFSPSNLKTNTPVTYSNDSSCTRNTSPKDLKFSNTGSQDLLENVEKVLKKGKEIRKNLGSEREQSCKSATPKMNFEREIDDEKMIYYQTLYKQFDVAENLSLKKKFKSEKINKDVEVQTENMKSSLKANVSLENDFLTNSSSTSYKSPPEVIHCCNIPQLFSYLEKFSDVEDNEKDTNFCLSGKINNVMTVLLDKQKEKSQFSSSSLEYYILKLLDMSRENVADLSVSSDSYTSSSFTDLEFCNESNESNGVKNANFPILIPFEAEKFVRDSRLKRAATWEDNIKVWRAVLGENFKEFRTSLGRNKNSNVPHPTEMHITKNSDFTISPKNTKEIIISTEKKSKYDAVSLKCSQQISELASLLSKKESKKQNLQHDCSPTFKNSGRSYSDKFFVNQSNPNNFLKYVSTKDVLKSITEKSRGSSNFHPNSSNTSDSLLDVEQELLKRKILTSPFQWSEAERSVDIFADSQDSKPPIPINKVIESFRKEVSKIKPLVCKPKHK